MRIVKSLVTLAILTIAFDLVAGLPGQQWLWERGLIGGIYGVCCMTVLCGGLLLVECGTGRRCRAGREG